jgi:Ca2+-binding RTX toxin-like protein
VINAADDVIVEAAGGGTDTAIVSLNFSMSALAHVEVLKLADGTAATQLTGGAGNDRLIGNTAFNILDGGAGLDTLEGGAGSDVFLVDNAGDVVVEAAGGGLDAVQASASYVLGAAVEVEILTALGAGTLALTGNAFANTLNGNAGANTSSSASSATTPWPAASAPTASPAVSARTS